MTSGKFKPTFIDLFAGIGGLRIGFDKMGGECVFSSEIDKFARQTYEANYDHTPEGDITIIPAESIPPAIDAAKNPRNSRLACGKNFHRFAP